MTCGEVLGDSVSSGVGEGSGGSGDSVTPGSLSVGDGGCLPFDSVRAPSFGALSMQTLRQLSPVNRVLTNHR